MNPEGRAPMSRSTAESSKVRPPAQGNPPRPGDDRCGDHAVPSFTQPVGRPRARSAMWEWLGRIHAALGRSASATACAIRLRNQCDAIVGHHVSDGPNPERNGEVWLAALVAPMASVFIDVGANVGDWSAHFLSAMKPPIRGLLFEPGSGASAVLGRRFRERPEIELIDAAASDRAGEAVFYEEQSAGQTSSLIATFSRQDAKEHRVRMTTVDAEVAKREIRDVDMLKIDTEGYDLHVLRGASEILSDHRVGIVQFEYNRPWAEAGSTLAAALKFLCGMNYEVFLLKAQGLYTLKYSRYGEFLSYSNFVAVSPQWRDRIRPHLRGHI